MLRSGLLLLLVTLGLRAPTGGPPTPATGSLPNGLRYSVETRPGAPLAAIDVWVRAGSGYEGPGEAGAAHMLEHMVFKGTPGRPAGAIDAAIEGMGGILSAATQRGAAHFATTVEPGKVREALAVVADALRRPALDAGELERERRVVMAELARRGGEGATVSAEAVWRRLCGASPLAGSPAGSAEGITALTADALRAFHRRLYRPDAACVAVVGALPEAEVRTALEAAFGDWAAPTAPPVAPPAPPAADPATPRPHMVMPLRVGPEGRAWFTAGYAAPSTAPAAVDRLLGLLLADPAVGRLAREGLRPAVALVVETHELPGITATLVAGCDDGGGQALPAALRATLQSLVERPPDASEIAAARARLLGLRHFEMETAAGAARLAGAAMLLGAAPADLRLRTAAAGVTAEQIAARAAQWLASEVTALAVGEPRP